MQKFEYPMFSPHEKAKLYKRYTGNVSVEMVAETEEDDAKIITIQDNRYVYKNSFKWVEITSSEESDNQPVDGLVVESEYITIRTNSLNDFKKGDVIELPKSSRLGGHWIVTDGKTTEYTYTPKQVQTYQNIPLSSVG